ncbi:hypothetical protein CDAR_441731 [Caerostris darwini]|uniref:Ribosomal protein L5 n=1 Tax=Caerostris darwini TaxID=1538125 RepID=A0AAV4UPM5_9ARAC|nr:hypothetical protein CDAR_441731 [Caerostris darwini]
MHFNPKTSAILFIRYNIQHNDESFPPCSFSNFDAYMRAFRNTFYAGDFPPPPLRRNETISQHTISLHFIPEKQYAFSAKNTLPFQYQSYSSFAHSLDSPRFPILEHGILIRLETRSRTTELPRRTCMSGRLSGTRFVAKWKSDVFFCEGPG